MGHYKNPYFFGGVEISNYELYKRLSLNGNKITIISSKYPGFKNYEVNENFNYVFVGYAFGKKRSAFAFPLSSFITAAKICRDYDILIEDLTVWSPSFSFLLQKKKPVILRIHDFADLTTFTRKNGFLIGPCLYGNIRIYPRLFKNWIVVSNALNARFGINGRVIGNGIDEQMLEAVQKKGDYIAYMGRFDIVKKGLDILIEALDILRKEGWLMKNNLKLKMAGEGQDKGKLLKIISQKELSNLIDVVGWVEGREKTQFIENAEFLVMPSRFEGEPIVSLEAGACYKPMIHSDIPEFFHVIENGYGISFKNFSPQGLAEKIRYLHEHTEIREEMGRRGRQFAEMNTWFHIGKKYEGYLEERIRDFSPKKANHQCFARF